MSSIQLVSKLTIKSMKAQPKRDSVKEPTVIATVFGRCSEKRVGSSDFGDYVRFIGEFEGLNAETGVSYRSGELIVPKILENLLNGAVTDDATVDFAVEIGVEPNESSVTGYSYTVQPLIKPAESDALAELRALALPAPDKK